ncbi:YgcG family protein [Maritimibacter sp. DP1N21-5]|uniref:TPM domain-containing protein n=1 Tax=Maritimibacter sp. DP1N21-5 TaxID=2836867 RepID=UPI001C465667|nr:TPM domain-containing protein [Maritimibacter sp. DP1N21-5]MBV7409722.1 TPM domain-containing protein [Maritimibacter sp. DP1N21-5]
MLRWMAFIFALGFAPLTAQEAAESWPVYENVYVNDYAGVIDLDAETRIKGRLELLREETGVETTVLTLPTRQGFTATPTMEDFATRLFNHWGIGDASRNDGILILVLVNDREMRVELGSGYPAAFDRQAQDIIDRVFLPAFREGTFSDGIEDGTDAVITRIARDHVAGNVPGDSWEPSGNGSGVIGWVFGTLAALGALVAVFSRKIIDRLSRCPSCGERGVETARHRLVAPTRSATGRGEKIMDCPHCGYHAVTPYSIPRITSSSSGSSGGFGGGSSSGGGASGRW